MSNKPDHEASMAKAELIQIAKNAMSIYKMIQDGDNLEGWISSYITISNDHLNSVQERMEGQTVEGLGENKKGVRATKQSTKPRNFVAKHAVQSGAGSHKDKKKADKQGDTKHKANTYESVLEAALQSALADCVPNESLPRVQVVKNKGWHIGLLT